MERLRVLFVLCLLADAGTKAQDISRSTLAKGVFTTTGNWRFRTGDDLRRPTPCWGLNAGTAGSGR
jgi:hypothetical protein